MPKLTYFPLLIDRWVSGTQELTFEERGFYISLIVWLYDTGKPIKDSDHAARILRCDKRTSRRLLGKLRPKFRLTSAGLRHRLCDELLNNGLKIRGLQAINNPTKPDPDPEEKKPPSGVKKKTEARGTRLAQDWTPQPTLIAWANEKFPQVDIETERERFRDYWHAAPGQRGRKSDWDATWRNWIRKAAETGHRSKGNGQAKPKRPTNGSWQQGIDAMAAQLGISAKPGESYEAFGARVRAAATRAH